MTSTSPLTIRRLETASKASSSVSKTRAGPVSGGRGVLELDDRAVGRQIALQHDQAAARFDGVVQVADDILAGRLDRVSAGLGQRLPRHGGRIAGHVAAVDQPIHEDGHAAGFEEIERDVLGRWGAYRR